MPNARVERRLAAIMVTDIVGYSRLVEADEARTLAAIKTIRSQIVDPLLADHRGRIVKLMGDGAIMEFGSAVDAVACAVVLQRGVTESQLGVPPKHRIIFRIGINLGDVVVEGEDLLGDGVNIAARLQGLAEPGGIFITDTVKKQLSGKTDLRFEDAGERMLKNISQPVQVYRLISDVQALSAPLNLPTRTSIAILPFTNMSSDPEQEYFGDGLAEDLITDLSKVPGLLVIARNSSFAYKGRHTDVRSVARDLGVHYVIEGSVRRSAARIRINAQLIDATNNSHIWADRFDCDLSDIFQLQDEVGAKIVSALAHVLPSAAYSAGRRTNNLEAYDFFVRGRALVTQSSESNEIARSLLERSLELDPGFADAHAWLGMSHVCSWAWAEGSDAHRKLAIVAAQQAASLDPANAEAQAVIGYVMNFVGKWDEAAVALATALRINPNHADAWTFWGEMKAHEGSPIEGIDYVQKALRLNPHPPGWYYWLLGYVQYAAGRYEDAADTLRHELTHRLGSQRILAASLAQLGRLEEAKVETEQFLAAHPHFSTQQWSSTQPFRNNTDREHFADGYIKAGLPR